MIPVGEVILAVCAAFIVGAACGAYALDWLTNTSFPWQ
jgi:hypothetical protein